MTISELWPVRRIAVHSPTLELRVPDEADLEAAARVAARGIYDPQNCFVHAGTLRSVGFKLNQ